MIIMEQQQQQQQQQQQLEIWPVAPERRGYCSKQFNLITTPIIIIIRRGRILCRTKTTVTTTKEQK